MDDHRAEDQSAARHEAIDELIEIVRRDWHQHPELRLMQLLLNASELTKVPNPFYLEDSMVAYGLGRLAVVMGDYK